MTILDVTVEYNRLDELFLVIAKDPDIELDYQDPYRCWGISKNNYGVVYEANNASDAYCVKTMLEQGTLDISDLIDVIP